MSKNVYIFSALALLGVAFATYFFQKEGTDQATAVSKSSISTRTINAPPSTVDTKAKHDSGSDSPIRKISQKSVTELQGSLLLAIGKREDAEEALRIVELKVSALEAQLDDIEIRGDDPVDAQDETLDAFQAVFAEYQDAILIYEKSAIEEEWIKKKLQEAGL